MLNQQLRCNLNSTQQAVTASQKRDMAYQAPGGGWEVLIVSRFFFVCGSDKTQAGLKSMRLQLHRKRVIKIFNFTVLDLSKLN